MNRISVPFCSKLINLKAANPGLAVCLCLAGLLAGCNGFVPGGNTQDNPTQFSETACAVGYYDEAYSYGFELSSDAELVRTKNDSTALTNSLWTLELDGALINVLTRVQSASSDASLGDLVGLSNDLAVAAGADLSEEEVTLSQGLVGIQTIEHFDGLTTYRVQALSHSRLYEVEAIVEDAANSEDVAATLSELVLSICVD